MNNKGVTLVEVMISFVILLVVFMGLIQASLLSINHNLRNAVRDEAVRVAAASMARLRSFNYTCGELNAPYIGPLINGNFTNCGYTAPLSTGSMNTPQGNFRNLSITYTVQKNVGIIDANTKRLIINVTWTYPGETETQLHTIYYTMRNPLQ